MVHGEKQIDGAIYYFDPDSGALSTGFQSVDAKDSLSGTAKMAFYEDNGQLFIGERMFQDIYFNTDANGNIISTSLNGVPYFNQRDPRWLYTYIGGYSFGSSGCVPTTATMIINFFKGTNYLPTDIGNLLYQLGYFNGSALGTSSDCWSFVSSHYGLGYRNNLGYDGIIQALKDGMMVAGAVGYGTWCPWWGTTHEILMFGIDEQGYTTVYDPYELSRCGRYHVSEVFNQRSTDPFDNLNGGPFFALGYDQYFGVVNKNDFNGTFDVKVKIGDGNSHTVTTRIWTDQNGQDDLKEYTNNLESDYYIAKIDIKDHNNEYGKYNIETYVDGRLYRSKSIIMSNSSQETTIENVGNTDTNFKVTTNVTNVPTDIVDIRYAVWSEINGQDDLKWIYGTKNDSSWSIDITNMKDIGQYNVHAYACMNDGFMIMLGGYTFEVTAPTWEIEIANQDDEAGTFDVIVKNIESKSGVSQVQIPVWCASDQSDIVWYEATRQSDGSYKATVRISNHKYHSGKYTVHTYLTAGNGIRTSKPYSKGVMVKPVQAKVSAKGDSQQKEYTLSVTNTGVFGNVTDLQYAVWSDTNGQDDLKWLFSNVGSDGTGSVKTQIKDYASYGDYSVDVYGTVNGQQIFMGHTSFEVTAPTWEIEIANQDDEAGTFDVIVKNIESKSGVSQVQIPVWCASDQSDIVWYEATRQSDGSYKATVRISNHKYHSGKYTVHTYLTAGNGIRTCIVANDVLFTPKTSINGNSNITISHMVNWFNDNNSHFDKFTKYSNGEYDGIYKKAGINSIEDFCQIYYEEATAEGIRVEVAFSQAMLETGFLTYGGQVKPSQFNFAGLGATDNGASGASFNSVREGIRAHIQHLKCYSSTEPLVNECVDPRWNESLRGKAIYVEYLSIPNNPYNVGWATDKNYSKKILNLMEMLINTNV